MKSAQFALALLVTTGIHVASVHAAPVTFFGQDLNTNNALYLTSQPNSDAARNQFFSNLSGVGTETFEGFTVGQSLPITVNFGAAGSAAIVGSGNIEQGATISNQYGIGNSKYLNTSTSSFSINFTSPVAAFGFYAIDIESELQLTLTDVNGKVTTLVPGGAGTGIVANQPSGSILYYAFYDTADTYKSVSFVDPSGSDIYAFDNFSIGSKAQVVPTNPVPEPGTLALLGAGVIGMATASRRRINGV